MDTGYNWDGAWTTLQNAVTLTQGGTTEDLSSAVSLDLKAAIVISIDADFSDHAKATGGLFVHILRDINGTDFEAEADGPWGFEMPFLQNGTRRKTFVLSAADFQNFKVLLDWDNSVAGSNVTVTTKYKRATIPAAS